MGWRTREQGRGDIPLVGDDLGKRPPPHADEPQVLRTDRTPQHRPPDDACGVAPSHVLHRLHGTHKVGALLFVSAWQGAAGEVFIV